MTRGNIVLLVLGVCFGVVLVAVFESSGITSFFSKRSWAVHWKLYGKEKLGFTTNFRTTHKHLLDSVPVDFQESLLNGIPLNCHPGPEGVLKKIHSKFLKTLIEYAKNHSQMKMEPSSRTLTWRCGWSCTGLGDRVRGITYSLLLAIFTNRRLVIFLEDGMVEGQYLHPNMVDWRDERIYQYLRKNEDLSATVDPFYFSVHPAFGRNDKIGLSTEEMADNLQILKGDRRDVVIATNLLPSFLAMPSEVGQQEWIASAVEQSGLSGLSDDDFNAVMGATIRYLFKVDEKVLGELELARGALGLTNPYTALHVRTGFVGMAHAELPIHSRLKHWSSEWSDSYECAVSAANRSLGKDSLIFLATDSDLVKDRAINSYPQRCRSLDNELVHVSQLSHHTQNGAGLKDSEKEGILVVWIELFLLAQANTLVAGESGFSWIAGMICGLRGNRIVDTRHC